MAETGEQDGVRQGEARFGVPVLTAAQLARTQPARGMAISSAQENTFQVYAWDVPEGTLRQVTHKPGGMSEAWIDPQGRHVYYLEDQGGNELGHLVRVPFAGGTAEDVTPDQAPYTLRGVGFSRSGNLLAFNPINADGFQLCCIPLGADAALGPQRLVHQSA